MVVFLGVMLALVAGYVYSLQQREQSIDRPLSDVRHGNFDSLRQKIVDAAALVNILPSPSKHASMSCKGPWPCMS